MTARSVVVGIAHLTAYVLLSFVWIVVVSIATPLLAGIDPLSMGSTEAFVEALGPAGIGWSTLIQATGLVGLAAVGATLLPPRPGEPAETPAPSRLARVRSAFALRPPALVWAIVAATATMPAQFLMSWIFERLRALTPEQHLSMLEILVGLLTEPSSGRAVLLASIVVAAPILEELVFRGYLWAVLERAGPPAFAWVGTSLLFAAYHQDPLQIVALLPLSFFVGWLRLVSGSIWPSVVAHFVNNAIAAVTVFAIPTESEGSMPLWLALVGYGITIAISAVGWGFHQRRARPEVPR